MASFCAATYRVEWLAWWEQQGWEMSYVVVIVAFSFYTELGSAVFLAWTGFYGTLLPVVNCWIICSIFPHGTATGDPWAYVAGYLNFFVIVLFTFFMDMATNAKMYALSWQALTVFTLFAFQPFSLSDVSCLGRARPISPCAS